MVKLGMKAALVACAVLGSACSSSDPAPAEDPGEDAGPASADAAAEAPDGGAGSDAASQSGYAVTYVAPQGGLHTGKSPFALAITNKADGKPATGLAPSVRLEPLMTMSMMSHGAPVPIDAITESATPGTYDVTLFFPMASVDKNGDPAGAWSVKVGIAGQDVTTLGLTVGMPTGPNTTHAMLKHPDDTILTNGSPKLRNYPLFLDEVSVGGGGTKFQIFLATIQEGGMVWPPVTTGLTLVGADGKPQLTIATLALEASTDDGATWTPMACNAASRCAASLQGLPAGEARKVLVKMAINGKPYTTDGTAPDAAKKNGYATFAVTP